MPHDTLPTRPGGLLADALSTWQANGWDPAILDRFRMDGTDGGDGEDDEDDADELEELDDDDRTALRNLSDEDRQKLRGLNDRDRAELVRTAQFENRLRTANSEAADRRRELKPWKSLGRDFGMTADQVREALTKASAGQGGGGNGNGGQGGNAPDPDKIRRDADKAADRRVIRSEIKRLATDIGFIDAKDALSRIDVDDFELDEDGDLDEAAVKAALKRELEKAPHLKRQRKRPKPDHGQGNRGETRRGDAGRAEAERRFGKRDAAGAGK